MGMDGQFGMLMLWILGGALAGGLLVYWFKEREGIRRRRAEQEMLTARAVLQERLEAREERIGALEAESRDLVRENRRLLEENTRLAAEESQARARIELLRSARNELSEAFKAVSADIHRTNNESFLKLAEKTLSHFQERASVDLDRKKDDIGHLVKPLRESLQNIDLQIRHLEKVRVEAYSSLTEQVKSLATSQLRLQGETANLVRALRTPTTRGRWGEMQLRRVVEMAGMVKHCDFCEQQTVNGPGGPLRPDMVINLPNGKRIVVDSKASLQAYLEAQEAEDDRERQEKMTLHARQVKNHLVRLGTKSYWQQFSETPEFVVMFVPGENFFSAALSQDPELLEFGVKQRVILATPTTLIALLRAVSYGWRQEQLAEHAGKIGELGRNLFERLRVFSGHLEEVRRNLDRTVQAYNRAAGSYERRVLVSARKFQEMAPESGKEIAEPAKIDTSPRRIENDNI